MTIDEFMRKLVARAETIVFPKTPKTINNIPVFYFEAVLSALRGPQPDPDTGLVPCGCGGKAEIRKWEWSNDAYIAGCTVCDANVDFPYDIDETDKIISDWNRAMGWRVEE